MTPTPIDDRCTIEVHLGPDDLAAALRRDVLDGLTATPKHLPPKWFYDERGSQLFDDITRLDEYYPTRRETEILEREAAAIAGRTGATTLLELGSGTSTKTKLLLDALADARHPRPHRPLRRVRADPPRAPAPALAARYPGVQVDAVVGDFERHLGRLPWGHARWSRSSAAPSATSRPAERAKFLAELADQMAPGDWLLLGTDLVKDPARLVAAYDDAAGVTAEFNRNVLHVLNRELDGDLVPERFAPRRPLGPRRAVDRDAPPVRRRPARPPRRPSTSTSTSPTASCSTPRSAPSSPGRARGRAGGGRPRARAELLTDAAGDFAVSLAGKP